MFSFPVSLIFGVIGIIFDRHKWVSITTTVIAAIPMIFFFYMMILRTAYH
jgi:hypothetical protein